MGARVTIRVAGELESAEPEREAPLRILFAVPFYPPVVGGAEIHASRLAAALSRRGHLVQVVTTHAEPMPNGRHWRDPHGVPVTAIGHRLPTVLRPRAYVGAVALHVAAHRQRHDVLQLFLPGLHVVAGLAAAHMRGTATAVMFGSSLDVPLLRTLALGRVQLAAIRHWADAVVVLNEEMRRDFNAEGISESRITWLPCSVDTTVFREPTADERLAARCDLAFDPHDFVVTFVGRLDPSKNLSVLVRGMGRLAQVNPHAVLCIVGDGSERASLERLAAEVAPRGRVRFLGLQTGDDVARTLRATDAFAMTSHSEGIPCALVEAMASGLPSLVHDIPALGQLVMDGVHGLRVPVDDVPALHRALTVLAADGAGRRRMGRAAREAVRTRFDVDAVAAAHESMYRRALAARCRLQPVSSGVGP